MPHDDTDLGLEHAGIAEGIPRLAELATIAGSVAEGFTATLLVTL